MLVLATFVGFSLDPLKLLIDPQKILEEGHNGSLNDRSVGNTGIKTSVNDFVLPFPLRGTLHINSENEMLKMQFLLNSMIAWANAFLSAAALKFVISVIKELLEKTRSGAHKCIVLTVQICYTCQIDYVSIFHI